MALALGQLLLTGAHAQSELYPGHFDLSQVTLFDSPLKTAMDRNIELLLQYDVDRLLNPYIRQSGLGATTDAQSRYYQWEQKHPSFPNWADNSFNLDGHVGGHYISALALAYAACHHATVKAQLKERLEYVVAILKDCQEAYDENTEGLYGFIGGQPINAEWKTLFRGDISGVRNRRGWVPFYCQHKILAGLRDAWLYAGMTDARELFRKMADWSVNVVAKVSEADMENMLGIEHGGMNESMLDAYQLFGDSKYLAAAKRYTHKQMLDGMQGAEGNYNTAFLDGEHANTQVPKYIGMERISEQDAASVAYNNAARNFWDDVASHRTVCIGGNSMSEHFLAASNGRLYIDGLDGPESCNTNNMLKLSEMRSDKTHDAKYADFYEHAMFNHILSTQDPATGGYVYFTTLRPQGYRIYSQVNQGMWCCVGTGMENHSKYGHFVYTREGNSKLYVNLFTASKLESDDFVLTQETQYPYEQQTRLTVGKAGSYTIAIRHPWWTTDGFDIKVNGSSLRSSFTVQSGEASYVELNRTWAEGDVITVSLPMELRAVECPDYPDYVAFEYGPVLLAAQTTAASQNEADATGLAYEPLQNEYAGAGRMDHAPGSMASSKSLITAPLLIGERADVLKRIKVKDASQLTFTIDAARPGVASYQWGELELRPFYSIHHARYMAYWYQQTAEGFANSSMAQTEAVNEALMARTIDFVATGEQQSEAGHEAQYSSDSNSGTYNTEIYRDTRANGYIQYTLYNKARLKDSLSIMCRFNLADRGRMGKLYVDGQLIADITVPATAYGSDQNKFYNVEFPIPPSLATAADGEGKQQFAVRLVASPTTLCPGLYYMRLMKGYKEQLITVGNELRSVTDSVRLSADNTCTLATHGQTDGASLVFSCQTNVARRACTVTIDGVAIATVMADNLGKGEANLEIAVDPQLLEGKQTVDVAFGHIGGYTVPTISKVYLCSGYKAAAQTKQPYEFVNTNFEKNGNDGNISSFTYNEDGTIGLAAPSTFNNHLNMRIKHSLSGQYSMLPSQYLFTVCGNSLAEAAGKAYLWWMCGYNRGSQDAPTYTLTADGNTWLVWDIRRTPYAEAMNFWSNSEVVLQSGNSGAYSLACFGLTSSSADHSARISDINYYSPEQLTDRYPLLAASVPSLAMALTAGVKFIYNGIVYQVSATGDKALAPAGATGLPASVFGYPVEKQSATGIMPVSGTSAVPSAAYDLQGRGVKTPALKHGVYISQGKKIIVR